MAVLLLIALLVGQLVTALSDTGCRIESLSPVEDSEHGWITHCYRGEMCVDIGTVANITCRQLGYSDQGVVITSRSFNTTSTLGHTEVLPWEHCASNITLNCKKASCTDGEIRIVGESSAYKTEGRVEACLNGRWGMVQTNQSYQAAQTVCHTLSATLGHTTHFQLDDSEARPVYSCSPPHPHSGELDCLNNTLEDNNTTLWVACHHLPHSTDCGQDDEEFRLVNGFTHREGRVEVCRDGRWGAVCNSSQEGLAEAVCSRLGFQSEGSIVVSSNIISTPRQTYHCELTDDLSCVASTCNDSLDLRVICSACLASRHITISLYTISAVLAAALLGWLCICVALCKRRSTRSKDRSSKQFITRKNTSYTLQLGNTKTETNEGATPTQILVPNYENKKLHDEDEFYDHLRYNQLQTNAEAMPTLTRDGASKSKDDFHNTEESFGYAKVTVEHKTSIKKKKSGERESPVYDDTAPVYDETTPVYDETTPVYDETTPVYDETTPVYDETTPVYDETTPVYDETAPVYDNTSPGEVSGGPQKEEYSKLHH